MEVLAEIIRTAGQLGLPAWQQLVLTLVLAVLIVAGKGAVRGLLGLRLSVPPPPWDPEAHTGPVSPPMVMPPGGMPVPGPGDRWDRNEP